MATAADDLAELKRMEAALRATSERLQLFVEHAPAAIAMFDRDMRYVVVSRRWLADYGLEGRDILGKSHYDIFPEIPEAWRRMHRRGLAGEVVRCDDDRFVRADGNVQYLRWEILPWRAGDGSVGGIVIFTEDTTPLRAAEQDARRRLANVSHEIRTPMNAILGLSHLLSEDLGHDARSRDKLTKIGAAANHLLEVVNDALDLPRNEAVDPVLEPVTAARTELARRYSGTEVLLAEDNEVNCEVARLMLARAGLVTAAARDGREAVEMARTRRYALVLMDVQMPHMDGLEATAAIRELPGWKDVPIVALTANALVEDRQRCLAAGMNHHLSKPIDPAGLYRCLLQCLSG